MLVPRQSDMVGSSTRPPTSVLQSQSYDSRQARLFFPGSQERAARDSGTHRQSRSRWQYCFRRGWPDESRRAPLPRTRIPLSLASLTKNLWSGPSSVRRSPHIVRPSLLTRLTCAKDEAVTAAGFESQGGRGACAAPTVETPLSGPVPNTTSLAALARQPLEPRNRSGIEDPDAVGEWRWDGRHEEI